MSPKYKTHLRLQITNTFVYKKTTLQIENSTKPQLQNTKPHTNTTQTPHLHKPIVKAKPVLSVAATNPTRKTMLQPRLPFIFA